MLCRLLLGVLTILLTPPVSAVAQEEAPAAPDPTVEYYSAIMSGVQSKLGLFEYRPHEERGKMGAVEPEWTRIGFVPFVRSWAGAVYPNSVPSPAERGAQAAAFAAPGEIEPISFCIRTMEAELSGLRLTPGALVSLRTESFIPPDAVEIGVVEYFPVRWGKGSAARNWRWHPTRIWPVERFPGNRFCQREPLGTLRVSPNTTVRFWIRIHTPADVQPGEYTGSVLVEHWGDSYRLPVTFTVLPAMLRSQGLPPFGAFIPGQLDRYACADLAACGIRSVARWYDAGQLGLSYQNGIVRPDFRLEDMFMRRLTDTGIDGPQIVYAVGSGRAPFDSSLASALTASGDTTGPSPELVYAQAVQAIEKHASGSGWPRLVWGLIDRAADWGKVREQISSRARTLNRVMGYRANLVSPLLGEDDDRIAEDLEGLVSVWMLGDGMEVDESMRSAAVWGYTALTQRDSAGAAREKIGFGSWRAHRDGMFVWAYNWSGGGHNWNDFDSSRMDWMLSYRNLDDTFLPTPAWEGIREGIEDRCYIRTVNQLINSAPPGSAAAIEALEFLEQVRRDDFDWSGLESISPDNSPPTSDTSIPGLLRRALAGHIIRLAGEQGTTDIDND